MKLILLSTLFFLLLFATSDAQEDPKPEGFLNIKLKTLGGKQFWTDELHFHKWRIQRNVMTGHFRLLDKNDFRHAWGNKPHCIKALGAIAKKEELQPMTGKAVVLLHGLVNTRSRMSAMENIFEDNGYTTFNVSYASTRESIDDHATALEGIIKNLNGISEINFVCFSLGNLVVRKYLNRTRDPKTGKPSDTRIKRMVMLAPPNNGAQMAEWLKKNGIFNMVTGKSGKQIAAQWKTVEKSLATPSFEFSIIAGNGAGLWNPLMKGDGDFIVSIEETRLVGASDFKIVSSTHSFIPNSKDAQKMALNFVQNGYLKSKEKKEPVRVVAYKSDESKSNR